MHKSWANPDKYAEQIKIIRKHGIDISTEMVVGAEGDTLESIKETANFVVNKSYSCTKILYINIYTWN